MRGGGGYISYKRAGRTGKCEGVVGENSSRRLNSVRYDMWGKYELCMLK